MLDSRPNPRTVAPNPNFVLTGLAQNFNLSTCNHPQELVWGVRSMSIEWHPIISRNPGLQCTQSSSSFALSVPSTSEITQLVQTAPTAGRSNGPPATIKHKRGTARRSLDLLGQIPKDVSLLSFYARCDIIIVPNTCRCFPTVLLLDSFTQ